MMSDGHGACKSKRVAAARAIVGVGQQATRENAIRSAPAAQSRRLIAYGRSSASAKARHCSLSPEAWVWRIQMSD